MAATPARPSSATVIWLPPSPSLAHDTATLVLCAGSAPPTCSAAISSIFGTFSGNFHATLGALRAAAGPDTPIIVMTYYNSLVNPLCPFSALAPLGNLVLEGQPLIGL